LPLTTGRSPAAAAGRLGTVPRGRRDRRGQANGPPLGHRSPVARPPLGRLQELARGPAGLPGGEPVAGDGDNRRPRRSARNREASSPAEASSDFLRTCVRSTWSFRPRKVPDGPVPAKRVRGPPRISPRTRLLAEEFAERRNVVIPHGPEALRLRRRSERRSSSNVPLRGAPRGR